MLIFFLSQDSAHGAEADAQRQLIEGAKKEGKLVFYTSVETEFARVLTGGFEAKYPFIKTDIFRSTHDKIFSRLNVERKAGTFAADVLSVGEFETYHMQKRGLLTPYKAPSAAVYPEGFKDPDGYWTDFYDNLMVSAYNTTRVKRDELPKRYEDLLQPRWRRRMVLDRNEDRWFANMLHHMGENKGMEFMQALAKQDVAIRSGRSLITQLTGRGRVRLADRCLLVSSLPVEETRSAGGLVFPGARLCRAASDQHRRARAASKRSEAFCRLCAFRRGPAVACKKGTGAGASGY